VSRIAVEAFIVIVHCIVSTWLTNSSYIIWLIVIT